MKIAISVILSTVILLSLLTGCMQKEEPTSLKIEDSTIANPTNYNTTLKQWGQGNIMNEQNQPISCIDYQEKYGQLDAEFINEDDNNQIMLTFDEGYENGYTEQILNTLKEKDVSAVFFITGDYLKRSKDLVQKMLENGQVIGNHTQNHPSMPSLSVDKMREEINILDDSVKDEFGVEMNMFRPPRGEFSEQSLSITKECGYKSVFWSFAYSDWDVNKQPGKDTALKTITSKLHSGAIYLLHAVSQTNAEILGQFIDEARDKGYTFTVFE